MEDIPEASETIAARRSNRIAEKIREARKKIVIDDSWWNSIPFEIFLLSLITAFNLFYIFPFWGTMASPDAIFSGPVIPLITKFVQIFDGTFSHSLQYVNTFFFIILPVGLYFFIKEVSGRKIIAFLSLFIIILPFSYFAETRVTSAFLSSDGAHMASLAVMPFALLSLFSFLKDGSRKNLLIASFLSAVIVLISPFGFTTYLIFAGILTFSEAVLGFGRKKLMRFFAILFFAAALSSFWYNPSFTFWLFSGPLGMEVRRTISKLLPISLFMIPILTTFGYLLFDRKPFLQPIFLASFFTIAFLLISMAGGGVFPSSPSRYIPEIGISISFLVSVLIVKILEWVPYFQQKTIFRKASFLAIFLLLGVGVVMGRQQLFEDKNVLGIWTGVERGIIWQERDKFDGIYSLFGYGISVLGLAGLTTTYSKMRKGTL